MRHRSIALALLPTVAVALGWAAIVVLPANSEAADLDDRLEIVNADVIGLSATVGATQQLETEIGGLRAELVSLEQAVPETVDLAGIVRLIDREAAVSGMTITLVSPQAPSEEASPDDPAAFDGSSGEAGSIDVEVTGSATYSELIAFLHGLTGNERFVLVKSLGLEGGRATGRLDVSLTIEVFSMTPVGTVGSEPSAALALDDAGDEGRADATVEELSE